MSISPLHHYDPRAHGAKCDECPLKHNKPVPPEPHPGAKICVVADSPNEVDEKHGKPFAGPGGAELEKAMRMANLHRGRVHLTNALLCRPPENDLKKLIQEQKRTLKLTGVIEKTPQECCAPRLEAEVANFKDFITLGKTALNAITGSNSSILSVRGAVMDLQATIKATARRVMPTVSPQFVMHQQRWAHVFRSDIGKAARWFRGESGWQNPDVTFHPSPELLRDFLSDTEKVYTYDIETDGIESLDANIRCIAIGDSQHVMVIGFRSNARPKELPDLFLDFYYGEDAEEIAQILREFFENELIYKVSHNGGYYDRAVIRHRLGCDVKPNIDTIILHKSVESELPHGLAYVASLYTDAPAWKTDREGNKLALGGESDHELHDYCAKDVAITARIVNPLIEQVALRDQLNVYHMDMQIQEICLAMHTAGMFVDQAARHVQEVAMLKRRHTLLEQIRGAVGKSDFNPGSVYHMRDLLFTRWQLSAESIEEEDRYTGSGDLSTGDLILRCLLTDPSIPDHQREVIKLIRRYRKVLKVLGTYVVKLRPSNMAADVGWDEDEEWADAEARKRYGEVKRGIVNPLTGRMHPGYNAQVAVTGRLSSSKPINCFDRETEILTEQGWIHFDVLPEGIKVAQWHEDGTIDFVAPTAYHQGSHTGEMVLYKSQSSDLTMTPNHRLPLVKAQSGKLKTFTAAELVGLGAGWCTLHAGNAVDGAGLDLSDPMLKLLVAVQADGSIFKRADGTRSVDLSFTKQRKIERLAQLLNSCGLKWSWQVSAQPSGPSNKRRLRVVLNEREDPVLGHIFDLLGEEKVYGAWLLDMTRAQRQVFVDEVFYWDGYAEGQTQYASVDKCNADWVQALLCLSGVRANVRHYVNKQGGEAWIVDVRRTKVNAITHRAERSVIPWDDEVFCVTVPADAIVVRRNGKVTITRQSQNFPKAMRSLVIAQPGNVLVGADMDQLELRIAAARWGVELYIRAFLEGKDPHSMTAFAIFGDEFCKAAGMDPKCFDMPGKLEGAAYKNGKFEGSGDAMSMRNLSKAVQYASQYMAKVETVHKLIQKTELPTIDPETKKPMADGSTDLPYAKLPLKKVGIMRDKWLQGASEFPKGWEKEIASYRKHGYIREDVTGRRRDFLDGEAPNEIVNFPIQASAAGLMNKALVALYREIPLHKWGPGTGIINQCHDSIVVECPESEGKRVAGMLEEYMNQTHPSLPGVRFTAKATIGKTWKEVG